MFLSLKSDARSVSARENDRIDTVPLAEGESEARELQSSISYRMLCHRLGSD